MKSNKRLLINKPLQSIKALQRGPRHHHALFGLSLRLILLRLQKQDRDLRNNHKSLIKQIGVRLVLLLAPENVVRRPVLQLVELAQVVAPEKAVRVVLGELRLLDELRHVGDYFEELFRYFPVSFEDVGKEVSSVTERNLSERGLAINLRLVERKFIVQEDVEDVRFEVFSILLLRFDQRCVNCNL